MRLNAQFIFLEELYDNLNCLFFFFGKILLIK